MHARPVWFLDVDGVLAPYNRTADCDRYLYDYTGGGGCVPFRQAVVDRIARMHASGLVEVRWLTTWGADEVQEWQRAGLGPFTRGDIDIKEPFSWRKANTVHAHLAAHPHQRVVWTDDEIDVNIHRAGRIREAGGDRLLALAPDRNVGLTDAALDRIEAWLRLGLDAVPGAHLGLTRLPGHLPADVVSDTPAGQHTGVGRHPAGAHK